MSRLKAASELSSPPQTELFVHSVPGHLVRRLQQVAVRLFGEHVNGDLTPVQYAALTAVADRPNIGQAALATLIGYDRATIGGVIDRLEQKGWMARIPSAQDRRSNALALTEAGTIALAAATSGVEAAQKNLLAPLGEPERRQFESICLKLLAHHKG